ncbi:hypothetical protein EAF00_000854 [Botryotinia globosa]|nr:hypothetical protein EAF00_000854 [Botryotinia globosa]
MSAYSPTITTAPSCPDENATWAASTILPPTANTLVVAHKNNDGKSPGQHDTPAELGNDGQKAELWANDTSTNTGTTSPKDLAHEGDAMLPRNQNESRELREMP